MLRSLAGTAATALTLVCSFSTVATATTSGQCNAGYTGCLAACGNRTTGPNAPLGFTLRPPDLPQECSNSCKSELASCQAQIPKRGSRACGHRC